MAKLGSMAYQMESMLKASDMIQLGESKKEAKEEAYSNGAKNSHDVGSQTGIYSGSSIRTYLPEWIACANWCKENEGLRDIRNLSPEMVKSYLIAEIADGGKFSTLAKECSALNKLDDAMSAAFGQKYDFNSEIEECRGIGREALDSSLESRAYSDPQSVVNAMTDPENKMVAQLQLETGLRIGDAQTIRPSEMQDGSILVENSKNGQDIIVTPSKELYDQIAENGGVKVAYDAYLTDLKQACANVGESYSGSHSLRHNFAISTYESYRESGLSHKESLHETAEKMGHHRGEITERYLR